jgi:hypothetical protein
VVAVNEPENGNIAQNKLHTVTGNIPRILVDYYRSTHTPLLLGRVVDSSVMGN